MSLVFVSLLAMASCNKSNVSLDTAAAQSTADSLITVQTKSIEDSVNTACQTRLTTEVAAKADSMFKATSAWLLPCCSSGQIIYSSNQKNNLLKSQTS
ncbi:MAG: hypothetical protein IPN94_18000 [Sphingobacteriales bacterium]|nr:hypothetical protein [Sphingobacteriales bacterium]